MTTTPTEPPSPAPGDPGGAAGAGGPHDHGPRVTGDEARDLGRLRRTVSGSPEGRYVAGVAGGLARHLDIDPIIVRVGLVVLVFFGGAGLLLYAAGWLCVPEEDSDRAVVRMDPRSRSFLLYVVAALALLAILGDTAGQFHFPWPIVVVALIVLVLLSRRERAWLPWTREQAQREQAQRQTWPTDQPTSPPAAAPTATASTPPTTGAETTAPFEGGAAPTYPSPPAWVPPPDPRRRGPLLFWPVICLIALAEGFLGIADAAGADVAGSAYPALAVGIIGAALVAGAFWGRAGGLILLGVIASLGLVGSIAADQVETDRVDARPVTAAALGDSYDVDAGRIEIDLSAVSDPQNLDGRTLELDGGIGEIVVVVPRSLDVVGTLRVEGPGDIRVFGDDRDGWDTTWRVDTTDTSATTDRPVLTLDADLHAGDIEMRYADE
ncbi:PspC domain-containing protein [Nocardioides sp. KR10-350]|uniref:PspC domain-containing protein n=1 Tax=Nocardioides cheoyonin TaxID=3156615 RepID=UPI0032B4B699